MNKNDIPLDIRNIENGIIFNDCSFSKEFYLIAEMKPDITNEKLILSKQYGDYFSERSGIVYAFVIDDILLKIGSTTTTMKKRIQSYNCGKKKYRESGTCSTTNYFVLQSFLKIGKSIKIFAFFPEKIEIDVFGTKEVISIPPKRYEKCILCNLKNKGAFPLLCTQT